MRVLAVDDDPVSRLMMLAMVRLLGHEASSAADGREAWDLLRSEPVDVLITDREMPHLDGLELCRLVRTLHGTYVYVILATGLGGADQARDGMVAGADDYLVKPIRRVDLELRLIAAQRVITLQRSSERTHEDLRGVARRDALTHLGNRLSLTEDLEVMAGRAKRYGHRFSVAMLDVDFFKAYNDRYGHLAGDQALQTVAKVMSTTCRTGDSCYRYGGEEFACIYPEQTVAGALTSVLRIRAGLAALAVAHPEGVGGLLTFSAGIARMREDSDDPQDVVRAADAALYEAKRNGRDTVELGAG